MKKLLSIVLTLSILLSLGTITAFAAEIDQDAASQSGGTTITYTIAEPTYTVTIPATAELDTEINITAENVTNIHSSQKLTVQVTDWTKASEGQGFVLKNGAAEIPCVVLKGKSGSAVNLGDAVMSVSGDGTAPLYITKENADSYYAPGTYTGSMTFTISLVQENLTTTGSGTEEDPYVVYTEDAFRTRLESLVGKTYITLANDLDLTGEEVNPNADSELILDLGGHTLYADRLTLMGTATVKNGTAPVIYAAMGSNVNLIGLNVTHSGGGSAVVINGTAVIDDCTFISEPAENIKTYALSLGSIYCNVTATNVTLSAGTAAHDAPASTATFTLDGVSITEKCANQVYKTEGRP